MVKLNPYEFTIYSMMTKNPNRRFTYSEIAKICSINIRTSKYHVPGLLRKRLIKKEKDRDKDVFYYEEK